jgi:SAM-dependent methyltransferase
MDKKLLSILVDPVSKTPLFLEEHEREIDGQIVEGVLKGENGRSYPVKRGIPRFVITDDADQKQTADSFGFKWMQQNAYDSPQMHESAQNWLVQRYGFKSASEMRGFFGSRCRTLDAGCGSGFSSSLWMNPTWRGEGKAEWFGVDISLAIDVAQDRLKQTAGTHFVQADILQLPFPDGTFDTIFAEGVLHHTPSTERALRSLLPLLESGGEFLFYVYRKKGPIREFTDDYVRTIVSCLAPEEAWAKLRPLTKLGKALADLHAEVDVPEDVPYLGIKAGRYDIQRLIYWHFAKLFWNNAFSFEENNHVNFDWYHPRYAHRHTEDEIQRACNEAGLSILHFNMEESGFTIRAIKG